MIIRLEHTDSTNRYLMENAANYSDSEITVAVAGFQTAGRGMGTNTWESEPGKNLLYSILIHPTTIPPREQYLVSMVQALAVRDAIADALRHGQTKVTTDAVTIKWPNDIYVGDRKISGTLIDLRLTAGAIRHMVIGTGINVNQQVFRSDAPNPVSLYQITGTKLSTDTILENVISRFKQYYSILLNGKRDDIIKLYHEYLYRRTGFYPYEDENGQFEAEIQNVATDGIITLRRLDGILSQYEFKQVRFIKTS